MDQLMFHPLGDCVALDSQTVQSLLDSQGLPEVSTLGSSNITSAVMLDEEDTIQCGKCKKQFNSLTLFISHKEEHKMESAMTLHSECVDGLSNQPTLSTLQVQTLDGNASIVIEESDILSFSIDENGSFLTGHNITALGTPIILTSSEFTSCGTSETVEGIEEQVVDDQSQSKSIASHISEVVENIVPDQKAAAEGKAEKHKCDFCGKAFTKNFDLQQHVRSHTGEKPFQCVVCGRAFSQKSNVKKHMVTHKVWPEDLSRTLPKDPLLLLENETTETVVLDRSYVCQYCSSTFSSYFELKTHMNSHSSRKVYKCIQKNCLKTFSELDSFLLHTKEHTDQVQYRCHVCNKQFDTIADLGIHQYSHNNTSRSKSSRTQRFFRCTFCKSRFMSPEALEHHNATINHNYPCTHCGKVFTCERYLRRHLITHGAAEAYSCSVCNKGFRTEQYLNTHMLIHSSEKPHKCQHCSAAFNRKDKLARHVLIHQPVKKFKCPFRTYLNCNKEFNRQDKLKVHILTHSYQKHSYQCSMCSRVFQRFKLLQQHEKLYHKTGFRCPLCDVKCPTKALLQAHVCSNEEVSSKAQPKKIKEDLSDNVPTIEIIVMPMSRDHCKEPSSSGLYQVIFPTAGENDGEQVTPDQEVPV